ncbi:hypothetical protein CDAR_12421, partial [Caerostris darwini]
ECEIPFSHRVLGVHHRNPATLYQYLKPFMNNTVKDKCEIPLSHRVLGVHHRNPATLHQYLKAVCEEHCEGQV